MSIVQEVLDALAAVAEGIDNIQTISSAIKTGRDYLVTKHPELAEDLSFMCVEMKKTSLASFLFFFFCFKLSSSTTHGSNPSSTSTKKIFYFHSSPE